MVKVVKVILIGLLYCAGKPYKDPYMSNQLND